MPESRECDRVALVIEWYHRHARELPWRDPQCSPWGVLVSEVMLQQTPVVRVMPVWGQWMERWPTPAALAAASQADAIRAWGRLGYPRRAMRLRQCAQALVERHDGEVPVDADHLLALPGVGEYTAAAVRSFAFSQPDVVLDTNVRRVIARAWNGNPLPHPHLTKAEREFATGIVRDAGHPQQWNVAAMELGALVCRARDPQCGQCPLATSCRWYQAGSRGLDKAPRRTQAWHGTDRQVRGRILALLRLDPGAIRLDGHDALVDVDPGQLDRCLESLATDGLVFEDARRPGWFALDPA